MILTVSAPGCGAHPNAGRVSPAPPAPSLDWFRSLVRTAERGCFDAILFDGQWGPAESFVLDPVVLIAALAECSSRIGLGAAIALDHAEPFNIARSFAAIDRLTAGRSAWVAATGTARLGDFGHSPARTIAEREGRAVELISVVRKLWDSWEDEAILIDKQAGHFSNPDRVHRIDHAGPFFSVRGPLNAPRPLQGNPPVFQRGSSAHGLSLAKQTADVFVATVPDASALPAIRRALGQRPKLLTAIVPLLAPTQAEAQARAAALDGTIAGLFYVGTPEGFAARLAELAPLCDGFDIAPAVLPTDLDLLVDGTVPRLRALGLRPAIYEGETLREHLSLPRPRSQFAA
jgi:alkanesulfonate monooxygenase SsuD/methylene tetrahydromethanopterin reductase-like flavin-dependent oxidoreductase (luciferase family)